MNKSSFWLAALCLSGSLLSSCESNKPAETTSAAPVVADTTGGMAGMDHMDHSKMGMTGAATTGMMAAMNTMMQRMDAAKPVGNTDYDFARMMLAHHQGAVEMSALELKEGKDATLRAMAQKISTDQQQEIQALEAAATRLASAPANYKPTDPADPFGSAMKSSMDGMMKDMAPGSNSVDQDFAALMVPHHQSAVAMAKAELAHGQDAKLKAMAQQMITAQQKEIQQFKDWLAKNGKATAGAATPE